jgi:hypothetical protein
MRERSSRGEEEEKNEKNLRAKLEMPQGRRKESKREERKMQGAGPKIKERAEGKIGKS